MRIADATLGIQETGSRMQTITRQVFPPILGVPLTYARRLFLILLCSLFGAVDSYSLELDAVVAGLQRRYASVETIAGAFQQTYHAPGIDQVESGVFQMKRPGLMRWEYRQPEEKLFIADGREAFLYSPRDRQVTIQPFSVSDMRGTPLEFLLGGADIKRSFAASWETHFKPVTGQTIMLRLTPRKSEGDYEYLALEIDPRTFDLRRIVIRENSGNTSEFLLTTIAMNGKIANKEFQFKPPKGVEIVRLNNEQ